MLGKKKIFQTNALYDLLGSAILTNAIVWWNKKNNYINNEKVASSSASTGTKLQKISTKIMITSVWSSLSLLSTHDDSFSAVFI